MALSPLAGKPAPHDILIDPAKLEREYYSRKPNITGLLFMGRDTHAVSAPAQRTALEVLAANGVETLIQRGDGFTPTPAISRAILVQNRGRSERLADGIVITPSHNPPEDGG